MGTKTKIAIGVVVGVAAGVGGYYAYNRFVANKDNGAAAEDPNEDLSAKDEPA